MKVMVAEGVKPELFADETQGEIFQYALDYFLRTNMKTAVPRSLLEEEFPGFFKRRGWPDEEIEPSVLIDKLRVKYRRNRVEELLRETAFTLKEDPDEAVRKLVEDATAISFKTSSSKRMEDFAASFPQRLNDYEEFILSGQEHQPGMPIGWDEVTDFTNGIQPTELAIFAGSPGTGKSWLANHMAITAARAGYKVYLANLENTHTLCLRRLDCLIAGVPYGDYERHQLSKAHRDALRASEGIVETMKEHLWVDSPDDPEEKGLAELYSRAKLFGADLIIGDQLSHVVPRNRYGGDRTAQMGEIIRDCFNLSKQTGMASMWISQFNREAQKSGTIPKLHQLALSTEIEQYSNWVFAINASEEERAMNAMNLSLIKSRTSRQARWLLNWNLDIQTQITVSHEIENAA